MDKDKKKPDKPFLSFSRREVIALLILITVASLLAGRQQVEAARCVDRGGLYIFQVPPLLGYCEEPVESGSAAVFIPFLTILTSLRRNDGHEPKTMYGAADDAVAAGPAGADVRPPGR